jgi:hypothetical protein
MIFVVIQNGFGYEQVLLRDLHRYETISHEIPSRTIKTSKYFDRLMITRGHVYNDLLLFQRFRRNRAVKIKIR